MASVPQMMSPILHLIDLSVFLSPERYNRVNQGAALCQERLHIGRVIAVLLGCVKTGTTKIILDVPAYLTSPLACRYAAISSPISA